MPRYSELVAAACIVAAAYALSTVWGLESGAPGLNARALLALTLAAACLVCCGSWCGRAAATRVLEDACQTGSAATARLALLLGAQPNKAGEVRRRPAPRCAAHGAPAALLCSA